MSFISHDWLEVIRSCALTSLISGDVDSHMLRWVRAFVGHAVDGLDLKRVQCVCQQVTDEHPSVSEAQLTRCKLYAVIAVRARAPLRAALLTHDVIHHVSTASGLTGRMPLQGH